MAKSQHDEETTIKTPECFRAAEFDRQTVDEEARTVELSFSSEEPVEQMFGFEILDHNPESVRLQRLNRAGALLFNHNANQHIGRVENARIENGKGRATVRFGKGQFADEKFQDVRDGILTEVSVGYRIHKLVLESEEEGVETLRATDWEPLEVTMTPVPADTTVGVGREATYETRIVGSKQYQPSREPDASPQKRMAGENTPTDPSGGTVTVTQEDPKKVAEQARKDEQKRMREIDAFKKQFQRFGPEVEKAAEKAKEDGTSIDDFRQTLLGIVSDTEPSNPEAPDDQIGMSRSDLSQWSLLSAMRGLVNGKREGIEFEASDEVAKRLKREPHGLFIPHDVLREQRMYTGRSSQGKRTMESGAFASGGAFVDSSIRPNDLIELLRNAMVIERLGARVITGIVGNPSIPVQDSAASTSWGDEGDTINANDQGTGQKQLEPHRLSARTDYSKQWLLQSSIDAENFVREDLMAVIGIEKDRAAINGAGAAGEPLGIMTTSGTNSVTFGGSPTWAKVVDFETKLDNNNALLGSPAYATTPGVKGAWKTTVKDSGSGQFIWQNGEVNGYNAIASNQIPNDKVIFGNFRDLMIFDWDGMDVTVDPFTNAHKNQIRLIVHTFTDNVVRHPESFTISTDAGNQ